MFVDVTFTPSATGQFDGALTVASNDPDQPFIQVLTLGTGVSSAASPGGGIPEGLSLADLAGLSPYQPYSGTAGGSSPSIEMGASGILGDIFLGNFFLGSPFDPDGPGPATSSCNIPNGSPGTRITFVDEEMPPLGAANLYMLGHSNMNPNAIIPLGFRPVVSSRAGELILSLVSCP